MILRLLFIIYQTNLSLAKLNPMLAICANFIWIYAIALIYSNY